jgi:Ion channel
MTTGIFMPFFPAYYMGTVGYGDFYPQNHLGRGVCVIAIFWGIFLVSMMVVTLTNSSSFDTKEGQAFAI